MEASAVKRAAATKAGAKAPTPLVQPKMPSKPAGPVIIDDPDELLLTHEDGKKKNSEDGKKNSTAKPKPAVPERVLPAYYLDRDESGHPVGLRYVAESGAKDGLFLTATGVLKLNSYEVAAGGDVLGTVDVAENGDQMRLLWIDEAGRISASMDLAPGVKPFTFTTPPGTFGHRHKLVLVRVPKNGNLKVEAIENFRVTEPFAWNDYAVLSSDDFARLLFPTRAVRLEWALQRNENPLYLPKQPMLTDAYAKTRDVKLFQRQPPLFDETSMQAAGAALLKNIAGRTSGLSLWSLGDGADLSNMAAPFDYDMSAGTLDIYEAWLRDRYGTLKTINTQWKTGFKEWTEIGPVITDMMKARMNPVYSQRLAALKGGDPDGKLERRGNDPVFTVNPKDFHPLRDENISAWADFRAFNDYAFSRLLREFRKMAQQSDGTAQVGVLNMLPPMAWGGWEYQNIAKSVDWAEEHQSFVSRELLRNFGPQIHFLTASGGQDAAAVHRLWDRWLRGDNGCILPPAGDAAKPPIEDIREMAQGLTLLRNQARVFADPVAIYYSPRSMYVHWMLDSEVDGSTWLNRDARSESGRGTMHNQLKSWLLLLEDLGYAPHFITPDDMAGDDVRFPDTKIIILPKVIALSKNEAEMLRRFVKSGGCVVADGECGTFDGWGKRRDTPSPEGKQTGSLDADFGIARKDYVSNERNGAFRGDPSASRLTLHTKDGKAIGADSPEMRVLEPGIIAAGAISHASAGGGAKALFSKAQGKGRFFYLNLCLLDYARLRGEQVAPGFSYAGMTEREYADKFGTPTGGEALRLAVSDIIDEIVGESPLVVKRDSGLPARGLKRMRFDLGGSSAFIAVMPLADAGGGEITPILKGAPLAQAASIIAGDNGNYHWYDMRKGVYLGNGPTAAVKIEPNRPALLASLPYQVDRMSVKVRRLLQNNIFKINPEVIVAGPAPGKHVFHVEVTDPAGNIMPYYSANLVAENGTCSHVIALSISDPAGVYHVKVRDVLTGKEAEGDLVKEGVDYEGLKLEAPKTQ